MSVQMVRFRTTPELAPVAAEQIETVFAAVQAAAPAGVKYTALQEADAPVFTLILELPDGVDNPLPSIPAAAAFRSWMMSHADDDTAPRSCTIVGRYSA